MEEIDLKELLSYFWSKILIIIAVVVVSVAMSIIYRSAIKTPLYQSYTTIVLTRSESSDDLSDNGITQNDITLNQKLVSTYREIMKSRRVLDQVIEDLHLEVTASELKGRISVVSEQDTEIIRITVTDEDSADAKNIANAIARVFSNEIVKLYSIKNVSVIDAALEQDAPYNINPLKETVLALLIGVVLGCAAVFVMYYFDTTVKSADEVEKKLGLVILGSVPRSSKGGKQ